MATPTSLVLDDQTNPQRTKQFDDALAKGGAASRVVIRELADAYVRWVTKHGRIPTFPLSIVSSDEKPKK